jgi:hypothetical protein
VVRVQPEVCPRVEVEAPVVREAGAGRKHRLVKLMSGCVLGWEH